MVVKSYRGLLADGGQDRIRLQTIKGKVGYRIKKLQVFVEKPGTTAQESIIKIFKVSDKTIDAEVDFSDQALLGVAHAVVFNATASNNIVSQYDVIFEQEMFNQDIFIMHKDVDPSASSCNYYLELEVIPLDDAGAEYTTLKDMRQT